MSSRTMLYVGRYTQMYLHTILDYGMDSRDGLPRGALPSGILKIGKYCPGLEVRSPIFTINSFNFTQSETDMQDCECIEGESDIRKRSEI